MNKLFSIVLAAIVCCSVISCNEKPKHYRFVTIGNDGKEKVEDISAKNDTDALNQYFDRMEKILVENIGKGGEPSYKAMYVISPEGDTLNTNKELLQSVMKDLPVLMTPEDKAAQKLQPVDKEPIPAGKKPVHDGKKPVPDGKKPVPDGKKQIPLDKKPAPAPKRLVPADKP